MYSLAVTSSCSKIRASAPIGFDIALSTESDERRRMFRLSVSVGRGEGVRGKREADEVSSEEEVVRSFGVIQAGVERVGVEGEEEEPPRARSRSCWIEEERGGGGGGGSSEASCFTAVATFCSNSDWVMLESEEASRVSMNEIAAFCDQVAARQVSR